MKKVLSVVVSVYNEEQALPAFMRPQADSGKSAGIMSCCL